MEAPPTRKHRSGYLYKRGADGEYIPANDKKPGVYYLQYRIAGKKHRQCLDTSDPDEAEQKRLKIMAPFMVSDEKEAIRTMKQRLEAADEKLAEINRERNPPLTVDHAWQAYVASVNRPDSGPRTLKGYASQWTLFAEWIKERHPSCVPLANIGRDIAETYAGYLLHKDTFPVSVSPAPSSGEEQKPTAGRVKPAFSTNTYNKHIRVLELVFRVLADKAGLTMNPWSNIARKTEIKDSRRELTVKELNTICNNASGELQVLLALGIYTGLRLGDCCTLRWSEVDIDRRIILRVPNKTSRRKDIPVHIPIHPTLFAVLEQKPARERQGYVLPGFAAKYQNNSSDVAKELRLFFIACGIQVHKDNTGFKMVKGKRKRQRRVHTGTRAVVEVGFHSLRHSFVSLCRQSNAPLAVVEAIVGHSNPAMTRHYTHIGDAAAAQAIALLPKLSGDAEGKEEEKTDKKVSEVKDLLDALKSMTVRNWRLVRDNLVASLSARDVAKVVRRVSAGDRR